MNNQEVKFRDLYNKRKKTFWIIGGLFLLLILHPFKIVQSNEVGLRFRLGALKQGVLEPGFHFRTPFLDKIKTISLQPMQLDHKVTVGGDGAITKDNQTIGADLTVFFVYQKDRATEMWAKYGVDKINSVLSATLRENFKSAIGTKDIFTLAGSQAAIQKEVFEGITDKLKDYPITITELKIVNYDWADSFDQAIQQTMQRAQEVKRAEQELLLTEQQANKKVKEAEADKNALIAQAEGEKAAAQLRAEAKALEGEGIRKFNQAVQANVELELKLRALEIEKLRVERWNGQYVPNNNYGPIPVQTGVVQGQ